MRSPRYGTRSLTEVLPSVAAALGVEGFEDVLALGPASQAVVVVVDGLGHRQLEAVAHHLPHLGATTLEQDPIDAAFPTTTPVGLASLTLALDPGTHGFVGGTFEVPDFDCVLNPLRWEDSPPPAAVQPEPTVFQQMHGIDIVSHGPAAYARSGMTRTLLAGAQSRPHERMEARAIESREGRLDYVYLPQLDKVGHVEGALTPTWEQCLRGIDALIGAIQRRLPPEAIIVVTADHGMVTVPDEDRIDIDHPAFAADVRLIAGEPRMRHVYTATPAVVRDRWAALLGDRAIVLDRDAALDQGLFGAVDEFLTERIGDVIAIATGTHAMTSARVDPRVSGLRGLHGGLTEDELLVPALQLRGVA